MYEISVESLSVCVRVHIFIVHVFTTVRTDRIFTGTYSYVTPLRASATLTLRSI